MQSFLQHRRLEKGQIVLITLLVLAVATTVALSLVSRTAVDTTINTQTDDSTRAFSAAEAGVEAALQAGTGSNGAQTLASGATFSVNVNSLGNAVGVYQFPRKTTQNITETVWLTNHASDGTLDETQVITDPSMDICWSTNSPIPALSVAIFYKRAGQYYTARAAYDPDTDRVADDSFTSVAAAGTNCGIANTYKTTITFASLGINSVTDTLLFMRVRPLYNDSSIAVNATSQLPLQGKIIESTGTKNGINRKVIVYQQFRTAATAFDASVYSEGDFAH